MRWLASWLVFPVTLTSCVMAGVWLLSMGCDPGLMVLLTGTGFGIVLLLLQRVMAYHEHWRGPASLFAFDGVLLAITSVSGELTQIMTAGAVVSAAATLTTWVGLTLWPTEWPLLAQLALSVVVGEFGTYWVHRLGHVSPLLWRFHVMHHTSDKLWLLSSGRNHPFNVVLSYVAQMAPLAILGAPVEVLALLASFSAVHGMMQHANLGIRHGWFNWVFATNELHRWHHSPEMAESNNNFGNNIILWDVVFGTRFLPTDRDPVVVGLDIAIPEKVTTYLALPFTLHRYEGATVEEL